MRDTWFLHGWGLSSVVWRETRAAFPGEAPDLPGYGESPLLAPYDAASLADAVAARMERPVNLVGWSMGGMTALALAARHPDKVARLVLVGATPAFVARPDWPHAMDAATLAGFAASLRRDWRDTLRRFLALQARGGDAARLVIGRLREQLAARPEPSPHTLAAGLDLLRDADLRDLVPRVDCPTLVLHGGQDALCAPEAGRWLARNLPRGELALHERASHAPFLSHPEWFAAVLKDFCHG